MWGIIADGACGKENVGINCGIGGLQGDPDLARYSAVRCLWWSCSKVFPCCKENNWICESLFCTGHTSWPWTKVEGGASICSVPRSMLWCKRRRIFLANAERTKTVGFARSRFQFHRCNFCKVSHGRGRQQRGRGRQRQAGPFPASPLGPGFRGFANKCNLENILKDFRELTFSYRPGQAMKK